MADEQDDELLLTDVAEEGDEQEAPETPDAEEFVLELEGEEAGDEPPLVKKLRQEIRDRDRKLSEYAKPAAPIEVGPKPTLESCEYDEDKFEAALDAWKETKRASESQAEEQKKRQDAQQREFQDLQVKYQASRASLPIKQEEFDAADAAVRAALPEQVIMGLAKYVDNPAKVVAALGRYPAQLSKIADEPDMLKQIFMLRDLEKNVKTSTRTPPPPPERDTILRGSAPIAKKEGDPVGDKLLEKALKSGNMTEYNRHRKTLRAKAA
ncbi:hypothetical protein FPZ24_08200 [Sphingomonas panacisoli]|uniref:Scaffolding protein n=1 Tax=Sphingomonas panacisoli TaxID=1813879 RepID=A0A5B8LIN3_9SPHN|nr:hypothetical protein [Sphingomonas panacisoli]QDZ07464.1 hypothetical protein FPZ24_08200 [Sphingomonas panacisoli]